MNCKICKTITPRPGGRSEVDDDDSDDTVNDDERTDNEDDERGDDARGELDERGLNDDTPND
jgi:hypothetical protein